MGLCKCPKRSVTNLFCFEHRVNVCEFCLVANHSKCIVQSYIKWLEDSDYNPICSICDTKLTDGGSTTRLLCYHVFHWECLRKYYAALPHNTAPAGYNCITCTEPLFPPRHQGGPVADTLRLELSREKWAREGLGLPLLDVDFQEDPANSLVDQSNEETNNEIEDYEKEGLARVSDDLVNIVTHHPAFMPTSQSAYTSAEPSHREKHFDRKNHVEEGYATTVKPPPRDSDDNKYARRSLFTLLGNFLKAHQVHPSLSYQRLPNRKIFRCGLYVFFMLLFLLTTVVVLQTLSKYANAGDDEDPMLNPRLNPNIRVEKDIS